MDPDATQGTSDRASSSVSPGDVQEVQKLQATYKNLKSELGKVVVGQEAVLDQLLTCIIARGNCLLIGVPGLAKTLLIRTLAQTLNLVNQAGFSQVSLQTDDTGTTR